MEKIKKEKLGTRLVNGLCLTKEQEHYFTYFDESESSIEHTDYEVGCKYEDYTINFFCDFTLSGGDLLHYEEETNYKHVNHVEVSNLEVKSIFISRKNKTTNYDFESLGFDPNDFNLSDKDMINLKYEFINILNNL